jgi:class 3 adenylate cyclase
VLLILTERKMNLDEKFSGFKSAGRPSMGLALVFDISGFTNFFNKPDIQDYITEYINQIIDCVESCIWGGEAFWVNENSTARELDPMPIKPALRKFLGDGMLYVWVDDERKLFAREDTKINFLNSLWNIQDSMDKINEMIREYMPVADLPSSIKFGLAQGSVYKLTENDGSVDYIGPCINLASRLVKYCPGLDIVASSRFKVDKSMLEKHGYRKVVATSLRSFEKEIVIVDANDYNNLSQSEKERLFTEL